MKKTPCLYYHWFDGDSIGKTIHTHFLLCDFDSALNLTLLNKQARDFIMKEIKDRNPDFVFGWADKIYALLQYDEKFCMMLVQKYTEITGHSISIGIGLTMGSAYKSMKIAKYISESKIYFWK